MQTQSPHRSLEFSQKLYRRLLAAYPRTHREEYGGAMAQLFRDQCRDAWEEQKVWGLAALWFRTLPDLLKTSFIERCARFSPGKFMSEKLQALLPARHSPQFVFWLVFVLVFLTVFSSTVIVTLLLPKSYASTARVKLEMGKIGQGIDLADANFLLQSAFENMKSPAVLSNVVSRLDLNTVWGKKYYNGHALTTRESMELIKRRVDLKQIRNTKLISITAYSDDRNEAAQLANAIAWQYRQYRITERQKLKEQNLKVLQEQLEESEVRIQAATSNLEILRGKLGLNFTDADASGASPEATPAACVEEAKINDPKAQAHVQPYWDAWRQRKKLQELHQALAAKLEMEKLDAKIPPTTMVQIIDDAQPGDAPVKPNVAVNIVIGAMTGIFLGGVAGSMAAFVVARQARRRTMVARA